MRMPEPTKRIRFTFKPYIRSHGDDTTHIRLAHYNHQGRHPPPRRDIAIFFFPGRKRREKGPPPNGYRVALLRPIRPERIYINILYIIYWLYHPPSHTPSWDKFTTRTNYVTINGTRDLADLQWRWWSVILHTLLLCTCTAKPKLHWPSPTAVATTTVVVLFFFSRFPPSAAARRVMYTLYL